MGQPMILSEKKTASTPPADGMEDAAFYFDELRDQVHTWSRYNFGDNPAHRPLIGMIEELCELSEELDEHKAFDEAKMFDAVGDTVIYMADYFGKRGWSLSDVWSDRSITEGTHNIPTLIKRLAHSQLKGEQNIRGGSERHDKNMRRTCGEVLAFLDTICAARDRDVCSVIQDVWEDVGKRDWKKNPNTAHEVAAGVVGVADAGPTPAVVPVEFMGLPPEVEAVFLNLEGVRRLSIETKDKAEGLGGFVSEIPDMQMEPDYDGRE